MCSDCEAFGLKYHGLTRSGCMYTTEFSVYQNIIPLFGNKQDNMNITEAVGGNQ